MRILVDGGSLGTGGARMRNAALGLALRGHAVFWRGSAAGPDAAGDVPARLERAGIVGPPPAGVRADLVLGGSRSPAATAIAGRLAGADGMLLALDPAAVGRWNALDRWGWESLRSAGLFEAGAAGGGLDPERSGTWSVTPPAPAPDACHPDTELLERACERLLARRRSRAPRPAAFLDRDGTLVVERGHLARAEDVELLPGVPQALRELRAAGYALVVVSNQSGVDRGLFPLSRVHEAMARLRRSLRDHGVELDAIYFCPHLPDAGCPCRKPGAALLRQAARDLDLRLSDSVMLGDKQLDVAAGHNAGAAGVLLRTGYGGEEEARPNPGRPPDRVCDDLAAAVRWLLGRAADRAAT